MPDMPKDPPQSPRPPPPNPIKPGQVLNPKGHNQYTYRADAERNLDRWCKENGRDLIERLLDDAKAGKGYAMKLALERILPAVLKHEIELPGVGPEALAAALNRFRSNGADEVPERPNGGSSA